MNNNQTDNFSNNNTDNSSNNTFNNNPQNYNGEVIETLDVFSEIKTENTQSIQNENPTMVQPNIMTQIEPNISPIQTDITHGIPNQQNMVNNNYSNKPKKKNNTKIIIPILLIIILISGIVLILNFGKNNYLYKLNYTHYEKNTYEITIKDDWKVRVKYSMNCSALGLSCKDTKKDFVIELKEQNRKKLKVFIEEMFKDKGNHIETTYEEFNIYEKDVLDTLISNDENQFDLEIDKYDYKIIFLEDWYDEYEYSILFNDYDIVVKKYNTNSEFKKEIHDTYNVTFLKDYIGVFETFKSNNFKDKNKIILYPKASYANYHENISEQDLNLLKAIVHNDISYLNQLS